MSAQPSALIAQMLARRETLVELPGCSARVRVRRPAEAQMPALASMPAADIAAQHVVGWEGMTLHLLLGNDNAGPVEFDPELWRTACADRLDWCGAVTTRIGELITEHLDARGLAAKN